MSEPTETDSSLPAPIRLGSLLFTLVDPERGYEVAYNRWYERDHFYAGCMIGPWQFAGQRFVATRDEKAKVTHQPNPVTGQGGRGSYLGLYWVLEGHHDEWNRWAVDQVNALHGANRMFPHRTHVHTGLYDRSFVVSRDDDGVPIELALDHRYDAIIAVIGEPGEDVPATEADDAMRSILASHLVDSPVALALGCSPRPLLADAPGDVPRGDENRRRFLHLYFCEQSALEIWDDWFVPLAENLRTEAGAEILWASPFRPTLVGTDRYTDELWES